MIGTWANTSSLAFLGFESSSTLGPTSGSRAAHWIGNITGASASALFRNGVSNNTSSTTTRTPGSPTIVVFGLNTGGSVGSLTNGRIGAYSFGLKFTDSQALAFYNALQTFQTALGRNV